MPCRIGITNNYPLAKGKLNDKFKGSHDFNRIDRLPSSSKADTRREADRLTKEQGCEPGETLEFEQSEQGIWFIYKFSY